MSTNETACSTLQESSVDELGSLIRNRPESVFAILDACDEPRIPEKVSELGPSRSASLYRGSAERDYWAIAPYLVQVDELLLDWIASELWGDPWGIFVVANVDLNTLRKHFRRFLTVEDPDGKPMYFRYYDPRVLGTFIESSTPSENEDFFGPIEAFYISTDGRLETIRNRSAFSTNGNPRTTNRD